MVEADTGLGRGVGCTSDVADYPTVGYTDRSESRPTVSRAERKPGGSSPCQFSWGDMLPTRPMSTKRLGDTQSGGGSIRAQRCEVDRPCDQAGVDGGRGSPQK